MKTIEMHLKTSLKIPRVYRNEPRRWQKGKVWSDKKRERSSSAKSETMLAKDGGID